MNVKAKIRKYLEVVRITNNELFASPLNIIGRIFVNALRIGLFIVIYSYVYNSSNTTQIGDSQATKLVNILWGLGFVQLMTQSTKATFTIIKDEILTGQIALKLNKPYSFLLYYFVESVGQIPVKFLIFASTSSAVLYFAVGIPDFTVGRVLSFFVLYVFGVVLNVLIQMIVGLASFWIENPDPIMWILNKTSWIFNGTFVPVAILPLVIRDLALIVPISVPFNIGRLFEINTVEDFLKMFLPQLIWILIFYVAIVFVYRRGVKLVSINGG